MLLWRRSPLGYVIGLGLLFQASMLFVGLIVLILLQTLTTGTHFRSADSLAVLGMGLVCFIAFGLFLRATARRRGGSYA